MYKEKIFRNLKNYRKTKQTLLTEAIKKHKVHIFTTKILKKTRITEIQSTPISHNP